MERAQANRILGRRIVQLVTVIGGLVALAWAMRERMISIDVPREDEPPSFRVSNGARKLDAAQP